MGKNEIMNKYLIALSVGGTMEMPETIYQDFDIIYADSQDEARQKYNMMHEKIN